MRRLLILFVIVLGALAGVGFATLNAEPVTVDYFLGVRQIPLSLVIVAALFLGVLMGALGSVSWVISARRKMGRLKKAGRSADDELKMLRAMPLKDA